MKILIETVPHDKQRYDTVGDWQFVKAHHLGLETSTAEATDEVLHIKVSEMSDWRYEVLVGIHEAVEALLCKRAGVSESQVDAFDLSYEHRRPPGDDSEPGNDPHAPYHIQHQVATTFEKALAGELAVDWKEYEKEVDSL